MKFRMTKARNYYGYPLQYWGGRHVRAVFHVTGMAGTHLFTHAKIVEREI